MDDCVEDCVVVVEVKVVEVIIVKVVVVGIATIVVMLAMFDIIGNVDLLLS